MEMRAVEEIDIGEDLTPPLPPLAFSLYDSSLLSHCSSCFSPLSPPHLHPSFPSNPRHVPSLLYCSQQCSTYDSDLHLSSAEHHLLLLRHSHFSGDDTYDLRAALRLLIHFEKFGIISKTDDVPTRICGLMSNRENLNSHVEDDGVVARIRDGAKAMAVARRMRDGLDLDFPGDCAVEEAALCAVLTNAVEVQVNGGRNVGIAVYCTTFSLINHSCSPNACYRFSPPQFSGGESPLRIVPAAAGGGSGIALEYKGGCNKYGSDSTNGCKVYGPRIICRSIKAIKKGEEVSIAYTDLLQPKALRQSELWLKYRFICCCKRCSVLPLTYVDLALQEVTAVDLDCANPDSDKDFYRNEEIKRLNDCIEDAISEYLSLGNAESCCEKLENALTHGLIDEQSEPTEEKLQQKIRLHPLHHLSLNTYTTLASAYKIRATDLSALSPNKDEHMMYAFDMSRTSAAYSLLLAGATHHLFLSESSLIASAALSWTSVGESLLNLVRGPVSNLFLKSGFPVSKLSSFSNRICYDCALMQKFEADFVISQAQHAECEEISSEFLNCITNLTPKVWTFLIPDDCYLGTIKDPIDFSWLWTTKSSNTFDRKSYLSSSDVEKSSSRCIVEGFANQERMNIFRLGVHCLLYGGFLSSICWGQNSYLTRSIGSILCGEDT